MNLGFAIAAAIALTGAGIHVFIGGPRLARPLLNSSLHRMVVTLLWFCFHVVTVTILAMGGVFAWAALSYLARPAASVMMGLAFACALVGVVAGLRCKVSPLRLIPIWLFLGMALAAFWGLEGTVLALIKL